jgi:hypothetical protein
MTILGHSTQTEVVHSTTNREGNITSQGGDGKDNLQYPKTHNVPDPSTQRDATVVLATSTREGKFQ